METKLRPTAITGVSILLVIGAILLLLAGIEGIALELFVMQVMQSIEGFDVVFLTLYAILLSLGIGYLVMSWELLKGKAWAWSITIVLLVIGIVSSILKIIFDLLYTPFGWSVIFIVPMKFSTFALASIVNITIIAISALIFYYLHRPRVKSFLGKTSETAATPT